MDPRAVSNPSYPGYGPVDLNNAYNTTAAIAASSSWTRANAPTVAIVDAFHDKYAPTELAAYRQVFGLPACPLTSVSTTGCFHWIDQRGKDITSTNHPPDNAGWAIEIALDLDMVSANCPYCNIVLVETDDNYNTNLAAGVDQAAVQPGVKAISNSYGGGEGSVELSTYAPHYNHPGIAITASSGDSGYGAQQPAAYNTVVAVGGTTLRQGGSPRGWTETAWSGAGSGCSAYVSKPSWQHDAGCPRRTIADVSSDSNPYTGVAIISGYLGNAAVGGTSAASPLIASLFALANSPLPASPAQLLYTNASSLFDVTGGSNGSCYPLYLCTGVIGYDGPTGNGSPNGLGAF